MFYRVSTLLVIGFAPILSTFSNTRHRYIARVMYDGTRFQGWQDLIASSKTSAISNKVISPSIDSIQGILKAKLSQRLSTDIVVTGASRTDAGVHARGQAIHFDVDTPIPNLNKFEFTMNQLLPDDVRLYNVTTAPIYRYINPTDETSTLQSSYFHATKSAISKYYSYTFCINKFIDPMYKRYCAHVYFPIDIALFERCLLRFQGTHDFSAFSNQVAYKQREFKHKNMEFSTIKTIHSIQLIPLGQAYEAKGSELSPFSIMNRNTLQGYYRIDIHVNSALYRMVRDDCIRV